MDAQIVQQSRIVITRCSEVVLAEASRGISTVRLLLEAFLLMILMLRLVQIVEIRIGFEQALSGALPGEASA